MTAADLLTVGHFDQWARALHALVQAQPTAALTPATNVVYSPARLAQVLDVHVDTVRRWLSKGKTGRNGQSVKLQAYYFTSEARIPWAAVLAYHRGEPFDLDTLPAPQPPAPPAPVAPAPAPPQTPTQDPPVLRVA